MVLCLQEVEFLLDAIAGLGYCKFELLRRLRWTLQHKNAIKCIDAPQSFNAIKSRNARPEIYSRDSVVPRVHANRYTWKRGVEQKNISLLKSTSTKRWSASNELVSFFSFDFDRNSRIFCFL